MTTVALEVLIDASRMPQGAQQVEQSLARVTQAADKTTATMANVGRATSAAFQVTGGTVQIAQGISQTAMSFDRLNISAAAFGASRTLLEVGRTVQDFQNLRGAVGGATSVLGVLGIAIRANPIGAIATVIGLAATAMSLFGSKTDAATTAVKRQETAFEGLLAKSRELDTRRGYGQSDPRTSVGGTIDALVALRGESQFGGTNGGMSVSSVAKGFGATEDEFRYALGEQGRELKRYSNGQLGTGFAYDSFPRDQMVRAGENLLGSRRRRDAESDGIYQFGALNPPKRQDFDIGPANEEYFVGQSANDRFQVEQERIDAASKRQIEAAERVADVLGQAGSELGQALFSAIQGGTGSLRAALANLLTQQAGRGFAGAFEIAGRAVAGLSAGQAAPRTPGVNP